MISPRSGLQHLQRTSYGSLHEKLPQISILLPSETPQSPLLPEADTMLPSKMMTAMPQPPRKTRKHFSYNSKP
ncbi:hypothetical protein TWF694_010390 [Orbilia ellipsospora]|uniref:Uncharacterized protein n=1 Tax=Orbilia ellipsospora TaxID=2528407 RepID=A0AAV9X9Q1_9PEZI